MMRTLAYYLGCGSLLVVLGILGSAHGDLSTNQLLGLGAGILLLGIAVTFLVVSRTEVRRAAAERARFRLPPSMEVLFDSTDEDIAVAVARLSDAARNGALRLDAAMSNDTFTRLRLCCQVCRREAPTHVADYKEVKGRFFMGLHREINANFCGDCSRSAFREFTTTTAQQGWFAPHTFVITLFVLPYNVVQRRSAPLPPGPEAAPPSLRAEEVLRLCPAAPALVSRIKGGMDVRELLLATAPAAGASPGQLALLLLGVAGRLPLEKKA